VVLFVTATAVGQQINPVPDYIFRNSMSVGRNAPTDTSAYFSIGPRFGATRGFMPPMVVDTAAVTGTKRNGLLIYSIQRNSFLYWDSTGMRWSRIAANLDTLLLSTRAWRQKGIDSVASVRVGGSGTANYVPKFTASSTLGNSIIQETGVGVGVNVTPSNWQSGFNGLQLGASNGFSAFGYSNGSEIGNNFYYNNNYLYSGTGTATRINMSGGLFTFLTAASGTANNVITFNERMRIHANGRITVNTASDGGYQFDVAGSMRNTTDAAFATASGSVGIGTASPSEKLHVIGNQRLQGGLQLYNASALSTMTITPASSIGGTDANTITTINTTPLVFSLGSTERMRMLTNGNIGINESNPTNRLQIKGGNDNQLLIDNAGERFTSMRFNRNGSLRGLLYYDSAGTFSMYGSTGTAIRLQPHNQTGIVVDTNMVTTFYNKGTLTVGVNPVFAIAAASDIGSANINRIQTINTTQLGFDVGGSERMRIFTNGRIGVNTTTDAGFTFDVNGLFRATNNSYFATAGGGAGVGTTTFTTYSGYNTFRINGSTGGALEFTSNDVVAALISNSANAFNINVAGKRNLLFQTDNTFRATIDSTGLVGINTSTPSYRLDVAGNLRNTTDAYFNTSSGETYIGTTSDAGAFKLQVNGVAYAADGLRTGAPNGGTAATWKLGIVVAGSYTAASNYLQVDVGGTLYYIGLVTPN
jgi:hypothetical protein